MPHHLHRILRGLSGRVRRVTGGRHKYRDYRRAGYYKPMGGADTRRMLRRAGHRAKKRGWL